MVFVDRYRSFRMDIDYYCYLVHIAVVVVAVVVGWDLNQIVDC